VSLHGFELLKVSNKRTMWYIGYARVLT